jgi:hypothetical protein
VTNKENSYDIYKKSGLLSSLFYLEEEFMYRKRVSPLPSFQVVRIPGPIT